MKNSKITKLFLIGVLSAWGCSSSNQQSADSDQIHAVPAETQLNGGKPAKLTAETHYATGRLAEVDGSTSTAISQYQQALQLDPNHANSIYRLGIIYTQQRQFDLAIAMWQRYLGVTQHAPTGFGNLGFCYELAGRSDEARQAYETGIKLDPKNMLCRTNYGLMMARQDRVEEAMKIWRPVLSESAIHYNLASVYELEHRKTDAKVEYQKALQLDPSMQDARTRLAALD